MKYLNNLDYPIVPFNHMTVANVIVKDGELKVRIDYERGNHYTFKKQVGRI